VAIKPVVMMAVMPVAVINRYYDGTRSGGQSLSGSGRQPQDGERRQNDSK
jgi:hypothetical protein